MKKIFILLGLISLFATSCDDFLTIYPEESLSVPTFYKTQADFTQAVNGAYAPLRLLNNHEGGGIWVLTEMHSDNSIFQRLAQFGARDRWHDVAQHAVPTANGVTANLYVKHAYVDLFQIIARANQILVTIDGAEFDADVKDNLKGQALFLRAFSYFELVRLFGKAPLHLVPVTNRQEAALPVSDAAALYEQIELDAKAAIQLLPPKSQQEAGRATSGAARMLLADAYMNQEKWGDAETQLLEIVSSDEYELMPTYAQAFSESSSNKNNVESLFEIQYKEGSEGLSGSWFYHMIPRPITAEEVQSLTGTSNALNITNEGNNIPTPDIIAAYEDGDDRKDASIGYITLSNGLWRDGTYPYIKKYAKTHALDGNHGMSWPVYRYSEVLLALAEVLDEQNKPGAMGYLMQVRSRAGLLDEPIGDVGEAIFKERRVELAFENKRWYDLVRTGRAVSVITAYGQRVKANPGDYYFPEGETPYPHGFQDISLTYALPASESDLSPHF
ncbi:RagB/SusD family nutrient uptake outer membrane protein [Mangrovibacterium sp.]|uniref:RagB/SusD family nutrient uptake outer membrane protein n=1 Tax=Mangrovibacterium sp. TaxID=1961364 RepID=UPI003564C7B6